MNEFDRWMVCGWLRRDWGEEEREEVQMKSLSKQAALVGRTTGLTRLDREIWMVLSPREALKWLNWILDEPVYAGEFCSADRPSVQAIQLVSQLVASLVHLFIQLFLTHSFFLSFICSCTASWLASLGKEIDQIYRTSENIYRQQVFNSSNNCENIRPTRWRSREKAATEAEACADLSSIC